MLVLSSKNNVELRHTWTPTFQARLSRILFLPSEEISRHHRNCHVTPSWTSKRADISEVQIEGLETLDYLDNLQGKERVTEQGDAITFESEVDKIYLSTPTKIAILDHEKKRTFVLRKDGLADAVVWNPWEKKAKSMADFGDDEYLVADSRGFEYLIHNLAADFLSTNNTLVSDDRVPGEEWKGRQELSAVPSSYFSGQLDPQKVLQG